MKKLFLIMVLLPLGLWAQEDKLQEENINPTKYEILISKAGNLIKYEDIKHEIISSDGLAGIYTCIRKVYGKPNRYFYVLSDNIKSFQSPLKKGSMAFIEYSDLIEVNKALDKMSSEAKTDHESKPYNLVNMFCTVDNFCIGYRTGVKTAEFDASLSYFIQLEKYQGYYKISKEEKMIEIFKTAQAKIEELMANDPS